MVDFRDYLKNFNHWNQRHVMNEVPIHREIFSKSYHIKPKLDCIYHFPIDLEPDGCPFGSKSIEKW